MFRAWLASFLRFTASNPYIGADYERLAEHEFRGRTWEWVDPMKDVNAAAVAVAHGWKTDAQIASDYGTDIDENIAEAERINPRKTAAGLLTATQKVESTTKTGKENDEEKND